MAILSAIWIFVRLALRLIIFGAIAITGYLLLRQYKNIRKFKDWPGPKPKPIIGTVQGVLYGGVKWVRQMTKKHGKVFVSWTFTDPMVFVTDPAVIRFLLTDTDRCQKGYAYRTTIAEPLGRSILTSETDDFWRSHRRILNVFFSQNRLINLLPKFSEHVNFMLETHTKTNGATNEMQKFCLKLGLIIFGDYAFTWDYKTDPAVDHMLDIVDEAEVIVAKAIQSGVPLWLNPSWKRIGPIWQDIRTQIEQKMDRRIQQMEAEAKPKNTAATTGSDSWDNNDSNAGEDTTPKDIATVLYEANMPRQDMMDEVVTLLSAGHETTAHFMAFAAYTLGMFPDIQRKLKLEVDTILGDRNIITKEDYVQLKYLQAFCNEALRWWNIVANIPREAADDIDLSSTGYNLVIPKGTTIVPSFAVCHRDEDFWGNDSTQFVPERWFNLKRDQNPAFFPFGFGKRLCIGQNMAQLEGACFVGLLVKKFKVTIPDGHKVKLWMAVTTKSETGTPVYLKEWTKEELAATQ